MAQIGSGWINTKEDGKQTISLQFDKAILPYEINERRRIMLVEIPEAKRTDKEKSPHYTIISYIPEEK